MPPKQPDLKLVDSPSAAAGLVEPVSKPEDLSAYEPVFLLTVELLDRYWPQTAEVLQPCIDDAMHGEMTTDDIYNRIKAGAMYCLAWKNDGGELPSVAMAIILELQAYPQYTLMNVTALGGRGLDYFGEKYWKHICSWAYMNGVRQMQSSASPAMTRMLKKLGFKPVYTTLRMGLET